MSDKKHNKARFRHSVAGLSCVMLLPVMAATLLILLAGDRSQRLQAQDLEKLNRFVQTSGSMDAAMKVFTEGRDLIEEEAWARASKRFGDFISTYPRHKNVDAARYWMALTFASATTFFHFGTSRFSMARNCSGGPPAGSSPAPPAEADKQSGRETGSSRKYPRVRE